MKSACETLDYVFNGTWEALRKLGYSATDRPKTTRLANWSGYFYKEGSDVSVWLTFAPTKCTRTQVGTHMVETPLYEVVCE